MMALSKIEWLLGLGLWAISLIAISPLQEKKHSIKVIHPGISYTDSVTCTLVETQSERGERHLFFMEVESVVCGDEQCRIDIVRLYWNELGQFERFELPTGTELEKAEGKNFTPDDYAKLNTILADEASPLRNVFKEEIVGTPAGEGVDAVAGETMILEKSAYVQGAVWTCYSLWHWAHGAVKPIIRNLTGDACSTDELRRYLQEGDEDYHLFALTQLGRRWDFDPQTVRLVLAAASKSDNLLKPGLEYLRSAPDSIFEASVLALLGTLESPKRMPLFNAIQKHPGPLSPAFYQHLLFRVSSFKTYPEINFVLNLLENTDNISLENLEKLAVLLDHENFLIARRVYWFLDGRELSPEVQSKHREFYAKYRDRL